MNGDFLEENKNGYSEYNASHFSFGFLKPRIYIIKG